jgi:hypothetical protein
MLVSYRPQLEKFDKSLRDRNADVVATRSVVNTASSLLCCNTCVYGVD